MAQFEIRTVVDLGSFGDEAEQLADARAVCEAVAEAVIWHGVATKVKASRVMGIGGNFYVSSQAADVVVDVTKVARVGVEWGGR